MSKIQALLDSEGMNESEFLDEYGFERVETYWPEDWYNWGDALYIKKK